MLSFLSMALNSSAFLMHRNLLMTLSKANYLFPLSQNLRDALDNMYDARIPALWRKVRPFFKEF